MQRFSRDLKSVSNWIVESNKGDRFIFLIGRLQVHARSLNRGICSGADDEHEPFGVPA